MSQFDHAPQQSKKSHTVLKIIGILALVFFLFTACSAIVFSGAPNPESTPTPTVTVTETQEPTESAAPTTPETTETKTQEPTKPAVDDEKAVALESAQTYVDMLPFSKEGLLDQLTSEYGGQFTKADAKWAVENVNADWNAEALESAKSYMDVMPMSKAALKDQLMSEYGGQFTEAQADYAIANLNTV